MDRKLTASRKRPPPPSTGGDEMRSAKGGIKRNRMNRSNNFRDEYSTSVDYKDDEEGMLLQALGSTMQDMSTYEESVIRNTELLSTPRLMMSTFDSDNLTVSAGFPSLDGLVPSRSAGAGPAYADLPTVQRVLERLRKRDMGGKQATIRTDKDYMKEQMLLSFLHTATQDTDMCVRPQAEAKQETERKRNYRRQRLIDEEQQQQQQSSMILPTGGPTAQRQEKPVVAAPSALRGKRTKVPKQTGRDDDIDDDDDDRNDVGIDEDTPAGRLEAIKQGNKRVSFAQEVDDAHHFVEGSNLGNKTAIVVLPPSVLRPKTKRRKSIQERRKEATEEAGSKRTQEEVDEEERDIEKRKAALKEQRRQREERKRKRRLARRGGDDHAVGQSRIRDRRTLFDNNNDIEDNDDNDDEETEFEFTVEDSQGAQQKNAVTPTDGENGEIQSTIHIIGAENVQPLPDMATTIQQPREEVLEGQIVEEEEVADGVDGIEVKDEDEIKHPPAQIEIDVSKSTITSIEASVTCPLCQEVIPLSAVTTNDEGNKDNENDNMDADAILAKHISTCQTGRSTRRRAIRGSSSMLAASLSSSNTNSNETHPVTTTSTMYGRRVKRPNYAEGDEDGGDFDDQQEDSNETSATNSKRPARRNDQDVTAEPEDEDGPYADDDDEEMIEDDIEDEDRELISSTKPNRRAKMLPRSALRKAVTLSTPTNPIDDWDEDDYEDRVDNWIDHGLESMRVMKERDANEQAPGQEVYEGGLVIPAWINDRLFPYQRTALQWMWELHRQQSGGVLGDEMGLGKTVQVASFLGSMAASRKIKSILIISPATMLQHWLKEMAKWAPGIRRILIHQSGDGNGSSYLSSGFSSGRSNITTAQLAAVEQWLKEARRMRLFEMIDEDDLENRKPSSFCGTAYAFVTTFENLRRNKDIWVGHRWSYIVMDEAQKIRNPGADITLVSKRLKTPHRLALSGTPIQNDLRELWSLFDFVFPGRLGTLPTFEKEFADPIKRGGYTNATPMQVQLAYRCALILKDLINPYLLRRLKKDIKEVQRMPGKKEQVLFCRLTERQRVMYEGFLQSDVVKKVFRGGAHLLGPITMLRKICNHPDLVCPPNKASLESFLQKGYVDENEISRLSDHYDSDDDAMDLEENDESDSDSVEDSMVSRSGKLEVLAKILPLWKKQGHRVLIFCQWTKMLNIIERFTEMQGWKFGRLDGNTNVASRQGLVDTFNSDTSYFGMLCTTRTGGVGLNLVGADRIILYDPDWNPQTDAQARERAWRFGQEREVTIYRLICSGTVEEKIYHRQIFKTALSNRVLQDPRQRRLFSQKDLKDLFSLKADTGSIDAGAEGVTETTELTKGDGYVDPDNMIGGDDQKDDSETMRNVLKSKGLAGVFDHGVVENLNQNKKGTVREMEAKAKTIAREALQALEKSMSGHDVFDPESRFGGSSGQSSSLLSAIAKRSADIKNATSSNNIGDTRQFTELLKKLRTFVRSNVPTTNEILEEFSSQVESCDAAVFRRLLKSVAYLDDGRWRLKK